MFAVFRGINDFLYKAFLKADDECSVFYPTGKEVSSYGIDADFFFAVFYAFCLSAVWKVVVKERSDETRSFTSGHTIDDLVVCGMGLVKAQKEAV